jgi:hypothetical protein
MRWPWSTRVPPVSSSLPFDPERDDVQRYAQRVTLHLHDQGVASLDSAATQRGAEWCTALTELGRAYNEAATTWLAVCDRFGMLPEPIEQSWDAGSATDEPEPPDA